ncbi:MAG: hypothetical protein EZS28_045040, partial [Streblomastix strix]
FDSLLITPVQRIPRFIMLTKEILKHTPNNHINREGLQQSMNSLKDTASFINDHIKQKILMLKMQDLSTKIEGMTDLMQPQRVLLKDGLVTMINRKSVVQRYLFLFSDIILVCSEKQSLLNELMQDTLSNLGFNQQYSNQKITLRFPSQLKLKLMIKLNEPIKCVDARNNISKQKKLSREVSVQDLKSYDQKGMQGAQIFADNLKRSVNKRRGSDPSQVLQWRESQSKLQNQQPNQPLFLILTPNKSFLFQCKSDEDVDDWMMSIKDARKKIRAKQLQKKKEEENKKKLIEKENQKDEQEQKLNRSSTVNLFADVQASGLGRNRSSTGTLTPQRYSIADQGRVKQYLQQIASQDVQDIYEDMDDNELEIITPEDPVNWQELLQHMNIEWDKVQTYSDDDGVETEMQNKGKEKE